MIQTKRPYESTFIVNASLEDAQIDATSNHIQEIITRNGGEVTALNRWGRKRLAYPIQKKNNGFYVNIEFAASGEIISQLERAFQLDENILRYLTIRLDKRAIKAREQSLQKSLAAAAEVAEALPAEPREPLFKDEPVEPKP